MGKKEAKTHNKREIKKETLGKKRSKEHIIKLKDKKQTKTFY